MADSGRGRKSFSEREVGGTMVFDRYIRRTRMQMSKKFKGKYKGKDSKMYANGGMKKQQHTGTGNK